MRNKNKITNENLERVSTTEIINEVSVMFGDSLVEKIMDFCETNDINPQILGDRLEPDKRFKELLRLECIRNNQIKDEQVSGFNSKMEVLKCW